jgi:hypothetical protein
MGFYAMTVWTPVEIQVPEKLLLLDPGTNSFNVQTDDLGGLVQVFAAHHARILRLDCLDGLEAIAPDPKFGAALSSGAPIRVLPTK